MNKNGLFTRIRRWLRKPSVRWGAGTLLIAGFAVGAVAWAGFESFVDATSDNSMCVSCHEMRNYVFAEYQQSPHYVSRSGLRPACKDCHVPRSFFPKMAAKIRATAIEIPAHLRGTIDTQEKFEAKREQLANRVWDRMRSNDSAACRNCHDVTAMSAEEQQLRAVREHEAGFARGETCIDCHQGIAHQLPASMLEEEADDVDFSF